MKNFSRLALVIAAMVGFALPSRATVYLDDFWGDGSRTIQNLPTESAWFTSSSGSLVATPGSMTLSMGGSAIMVLTYYTTNSTSPVQLNVGDALTATFNLTFSGVATTNSSVGFRIGLFDFADSTLSPKRVTADGFSSSSQGGGVQGYALFQNMETTFTNSSPMDIRKRTSLSDNSLLGTSGDYTSLGTGPGDTSAFPGFSNGTNYILQITLQRTATTTMAITASWLNTATGASLITTVTDTGAADFNFDGIGLRPLTAASTATTITFQEAKVEFIPANTPANVVTDPQDQSVFVGQSASFGVIASGSPPLSYQWYYNSSSLLTNATSSTLTLTNCQISDSGEYSVVVSNASGTDTSAVANLSVTVPTAPTISTQPQDQTNILPGASATFTVVAGGSEPLIYQWYYNAITPVTGANDSTLTLTNVQPSADGTYSVVVSNLAGVVISSNAVLSVNTNPVAPVFSSAPASQVVLAGDTVTFTAVADGTAPISYQWIKNGAPIIGATSSMLTLSSVQASDDGNYAVIASNSVGSATSGTALLTVTPPVPVPNSAYNLTGFGGGTTGGGVIATNDPAYRQVFTPLDFANAILSANKTAGSVKVIEIMNDLNLGWNEIGSAVQNLASTPFRAHNPPQLHPVLLVTGMSLCDIKPKSGLTIFSANGSTIRHCNFNPKGCTNLIIRNLKFDENWEWDEATKGQYDKNDWDFITIGNGGAVSNIWIDHCTFTKSYDGIVDTKAGCAAFTLSWCKYTGDDGATNPNSWVWQQINSLESSKSSYAFYNFLRSNGFSTTDIVTVIQGHDKTHLAGSNDLDPNNATLTMTFHHLWLINVWDRCVPRLRAGNVHDYNLYADDTLLLAAKNLRNARAAAMSTANQNTLNNTYSINPPMNGAISTENGALLVEKSVYLECLTPLRNNQTDPSDPAYTGKIMALDTIYQKNGVVTRGNSTDPGSQLGPFQAPIIAFSWNLTPNQLPYTYAMDDPSQLKGIVTSPTAGAGAGVLTWVKTNWLATSYAPTGPVIAASPQSQTNTAGQTVSFVVVAGGSAPLSYQWYFNTNSLIANATNSTLTLTSVQATNAGLYSVTVSNSVSATNSAFAMLTVTAPPVAGFTASPVSGTAPLAVTFTDASTGSPLPNLSWDLGDSTTTNTASGASFTHTYAAGTYTVMLTASNSAGTSTLVSNNLITATSGVTAFQSWQLAHFGCTNCPQADANADPDGDGQNNLAEFLAGTDPNNSSSGLRIISVAPQNNGDMLITWETVGGVTNAVQATTGGYNTNFVDITTPPHIIVSGSGDVTTNYTESGGATNGPSRFYRVRLVP